MQRLPGGKRHSAGKNGPVRLGICLVFAFELCCLTKDTVDCETAVHRTDKLSLSLTSLAATLRPCSNNLPGPHTQLVSATPQA